VIDSLSCFRASLASIAFRSHVHGRLDNSRLALIFSGSAHRTASLAPVIGLVLLQHSRVMLATHGDCLEDDRRQSAKIPRLYECGAIPAS
jgi:hypothetical protein